MGLPNSGKTTYAKKLNGITIEFDLIRKGCTGSYQLAGNFNELVHHLVQRSIQYYLKQGKSVVVDGLFLTVKERALYINFAKKLGADVDIHWLDTPYQTIVNRNAARLNICSEKAYNQNVIEKLSKHLEFPTLDEGVREIIYQS